MKIFSVIFMRQFFSFRLNFAPNSDNIILDSSGTLPVTFLLLPFQRFRVISTPSLPLSYSSLSSLTLVAFLPFISLLFSFYPMESGPSQLSTPCAQSPKIKYRYSAECCSIAFDASLILSSG